MELPDLPDWDVQVEEVSVGAYNLRAFHSSGYSINLKGSDLITLVQELEEWVEKFKRSE